MDKKRNTIEYLKSFYIKDYLYMALAIGIYTIGLTGFIMPNQIVSGGLAGAALLLNYATGIKVSTTILVVNFALLIVAFRPLGKKFVINTIIGAGMLTLGVRLGEMYLKPYFLANPVVHDPFIAIVLGGIFMGVALGMVYSVNGSTGGVDIIGFLVTKYFKIRILPYSSFSGCTCGDIFYICPQGIYYGENGVRAYSLTCYVSGSGCDYEWC